jgi:5-methylcytosine-specific restriction endonuclease McrA
LKNQDNVYALNVSENLFLELDSCNNLFLALDSYLTQKEKGWVQCMHCGTLDTKKQQLSVGHVHPSKLKKANVAKFFTWNSDL